MKHAKSIFASAVLAGILGILVSTPSPAQVTTTPPAVKALPGGPAAPLKGPMKLDPSTLRALPPLPSSDALDRAYETFRRELNEGVAARNRFIEIRNGCMTRAFSIEDQRQAGCLPSDAVWECNRKLGNWCTRNGSQNWRAANRQLRGAADALKRAMDDYTNAATHIYE